MIGAQVRSARLLEMHGSSGGPAAALRRNRQGDGVGVEATTCGLIGCHRPLSDLTMGTQHLSHRATSSPALPRPIDAREGL
jgi:hypothetical protein